MRQGEAKRKNVEAGGVEASATSSNLFLGSSWLRRCSAKLIDVDKERYVRGELPEDGPRGERDRPAGEVKRLARSFATVAEITKAEIVRLSHQIGKKSLDGARPTLSDGVCGYESGRRGR